MLSVFIREPSFHGQTKEKLANPEAAKQVEGVIRDHFDHWLSAAPLEANALLAFVIDRAEERVRRRTEREVNRKAATRKLPGAQPRYAKDADHREQLMATEFTGRGKIEVSQFQGLGEMPASQLKVTTMSPATRTLARIMVPEDRAPNTAELVEHLMGKKPELRLAYILEHAPEATDLDI